MANELYACTGTTYSAAAGNQNLGSSLVRVVGIKSGGTHFKSLTTRNFVVSIATYTATWTDRFDDARYYTGDTSA